MSPAPHPTLPGSLMGDVDFGDTDQNWPTRGSKKVYDSDFISLSVDRIEAPDGAELTRAVVHHKGAVGVLAIDDADRVLVLDQYRHPVRRRLFELPAGILDIDGESAVDAAARELSEEADLVAAQWTPLLSVFATPGCSTEKWQVFVARDLSPTAADHRIVREAEEADMHHWWIGLDQLVDAALEGRLGDSMTVSAVLAAAALRRAERF